VEAGVIVSAGHSVRMATSTPARFLGLAEETGSLRPGLRADLVAMTDDFTVTQTWIGGVSSST
jgi:N-acetylglucosamine-6-phosphate deacetylase